MMISEQTERSDKRGRVAMLALAGASLVILLASATAAAERVGLPRFPSISPDGSELVFSWRGGLWRVASGGGEATRLTRHPLDDLYSGWSPDGDWITFTSMRYSHLTISAPWSRAVVSST